MTIICLELCLDKGPSYSIPRMLVETPDSVYAQESLGSTLDARGSYTNTIAQMGAHQRITKSRNKVVSPCNNRKDIFYGVFNLIIVLDRQLYVPKDVLQFIYPKLCLHKKFLLRSIKLNLGFKRIFSPVNLHLAHLLQSVSIPSLVKVIGVGAGPVPDT